MGKTKTYFEQIPVDVVKRMPTVDWLDPKAYSVPCVICGSEVRFEQSNTDEHGRAVHEQCYVENVKSSRE
jgi:hypothetical protein